MSKEKGIMLFKSDTKIVEEIKIPNDSDRSTIAEIILEFKNGFTQKSYLDVREYRVNKRMEEFKSKLSLADFDKLIEIIQDYGSYKLNESYLDGREAGYLER